MYNQEKRKYGYFVSMILLILTVFLPDIAARYTMTQDGDTITLTDRFPQGDETLDIQIYAWPSDGSVVTDAPSGEDAESILRTDGTEQKDRK